MDILNNLQNCIKLTSVTNKQSIDFLDTMILKVNGLFRIYILTAKSTLNQHQHITYCIHPKHTAITISKDFQQ